VMGPASSGSFDFAPLRMAHFFQCNDLLKICRYCLVEFVGFGWCGDGIGEFGWVDLCGSGEAFAGYVADV